VGPRNHGGAYCPHIICAVAVMQAVIRFTLHQTNYSRVKQTFDLTSLEVTIEKQERWNAVSPKNL